jgi:aminopeptidase N
LRIIGWLPLAILAGCASTPTAPSAPATPPDAGTTASVPVPPPELRLPTDVRPTSERLSLRLDPRATTFTGSARIQLTIGAPVPAFWLHAQDLTIGRASLVQGGVEQPVRTVVAPPDLLGVVTATRLAPGQAELVLEFQGTLDRERSRGLYRVDERDGPYLYTFFEPVDARRAFPCFDEPSFKIPWELEISVPPGNGAFANTAEAGRQTGADGWVTVRFERSRPLPTYLVAFAAGPFDVVPGAPAGHHQTPLRFIVPGGHREELAYAQSILPRMVSLLEDSTEVPYPYGKLDVLVVPRYWGTMEHPGLVALGQPLMLFGPGRDELARHQHGANIAIHELAHYWYGDLVTTAWWDDTWLNESFGSWLDGKVTTRLEPGWRWERKSLTARGQALHADAVPGAKRIREPIKTREDIEASFDAALTYSKGRTVIGMFERWIGEAQWRSALAAYLNAYADKNATSEDLFRSLDASLGRDVSTPLASFVNQSGYPVLRANLVCHGKGAASIQLAQEPFVTGSESTWQFPVCARAGTGKKVERACTLLEGRSGTLQLPASLGCPAWVVLNDGGLGYYRVAYGPELSRKLRAVPRGGLSAEEQVSMVDDLSALAERGDVPVKEVLDRAAAMTRQTDSDVAITGWKLLEGWLRKDRLSRESHSRRIELFSRQGSTRARSIGWSVRPGDSLDVRETRRVVVPAVTESAEDQALRSEATRLAKGWLQDRKGLDEDVLEPVLHVAATRGDAALFDLMEREALAAKARNDRTRIIEALAWFEDPELAARARTLIDDRRFEIRDTARMLTHQIERSETRDQAWAFLRDHAAAMVPRMRDDEAQRLLSSIGSACDRRIADEARTALSPIMQKLDGGPIAFQHTLARIERCAAIHDGTDSGVQAWLVAQTQPRSARR